jgi:hypothetical protein
MYPRRTRRPQNSQEAEDRGKGKGEGENPAPCPGEGADDDKIGRETERTYEPWLGPKEVKEVFDSIRDPVTGFVMGLKSEPPDPVKITCKDWREAEFRTPPTITGKPEVEAYYRGVRLERGQVEGYFFEVEIDGGLFGKLHAMDESFTTEGAAAQIRQLVMVDLMTRLSTGDKCSPTTTAQPDVRVRYAGVEGDDFEFGVRISKDAVKAIQGAGKGFLSSRGTSDAFCRVITRALSKWIKDLSQ